MKKKGIAILTVLALGVGLIGSDVVGSNTNIIEVNAATTSQYSLDIDNNHTTIDISQDLYGLFYEDINSSVDGGMYPELIKNRSFENRYYVGGALQSSETTWKMGWESSNASNFQVVGNQLETPADGALNSNNPRYAKITGNQLLTNYGFTEYNKKTTGAVSITAGTKYDFSMYVKCDASYSGTITVKAVNSTGTAITDSKTIKLTKDGSWNKVSTVLTATGSSVIGRFQLQITGAGTNDMICLDMVSLMSQDTYGYGNKNYGYGAGLRKDLVEKLKDINPKFIRFAGGCIVEGAYDWTNFYNWEDSIGSPEQRHSINNMWGNDAAAKSTGYMMSYGVGFHEYLQLCEDLGAQALPIMNAGILCQARSNHISAATGAQRDEFVDYITHLIDYCWGDVNSTNTVQKEWASKRAANGHTATFDLNYIGIGNENWEDKYFSNFNYMKEKVLEYVAANYPGRELTIISSTGPVVDNSIMDNAWNWLNTMHSGATLVDEHYYTNYTWAINNADRYDYYTRQEDGGSDVFLGEYAVNNDEGTANTLQAALAEAAYMIGLERNSDVIKMASYAPLFAKEGNADWNPDMIWFNGTKSYGTPSYYVQKMFSNNYGTKLIDSTVSKASDSYFDKNYGSVFLGAYATEAVYEDIKVYDENNNLIFEDSFNDNSKGWTQLTGASEFVSGGFQIANGKLTINNGGNGVNAVWLPQFAKNADWSNYRVEINGKKVSGNEGFIVGVGVKSASSYYQYNLGGWGNTNAVIQLQRPGRSLIVVGNDQASVLSGFSPIQNNTDTAITIKYGIDGKLTADHTSGISNGGINMNVKPYQTEVYQVVSKDDDYIYVKLVNIGNSSKTIDLNFKNFANFNNILNEVTIECLSSDTLSAGNSVSKLENVATKTSQTVVNGTVFPYTMPKYSCSILKIALHKEGKVKVEGVTIDKTKNIVLKKVEETVSVKAAVTPSNAGNKALLWSSSNKKVAKVDANGKVTALTSGTTVIKAASKEDQTKYDMITITVKLAATKVTLNKAKITIGLGEKVKLKAVKTPKTAVNALKWKTSNKAKVKVNSDGTIQGKKVGKATITVTTSNKKSASCTVTVKKAPKAIKATVKKKTIKKGRTYQIKYKLSKNSASYNVKYQSSKKAVAAVSSTGIVSAKKKGTATITLKTFNNRKYYIKITVK